MSFLRLPPPAWGRGRKAGIHKKWYDWTFAFPAVTDRGG